MDSPGRTLEAEARAFGRAEETGEGGAGRAALALDGAGEAEIAANRGATA